MVKSDLMSRINKVHRPVRNRFDISTRRLFTSAPGMLLPVYYRELCPNNHISLDLSNFARTVPMRKAAFARMTENYDVFFVPFRLIFEGAQDMLAGTPRSRAFAANVPEIVPTLSYTSLNSFNTYLSNQKIKDDVGIPATITTPRLLSALGVGYSGVSGTGLSYSTDNRSAFSYQSSNNSVPNVIQNGSDPVKFSFSCLPFAAYQKIYQDYFRNKYWEDENTESYMLSNASGKPFDAIAACKIGLLSMRYSNIDRDRIFGMMPDDGKIFSQGINFLNTSSVSSVRAAVGNRTVPNSNTSVALEALLQDFASSADTINYETALQAFKHANPDTDNALLQGVVAQLNALSMKRMETMQRFAEICALNKDDYKHQMQAHFGVDVPDLNSDYSIYLGGKSNPINISEVEQTTPGASNVGSALGELGARGVSYGKSGHIDFTAKEHGYLMVIYHLQPHVDFVGAFVDPQLRRYERYDFMIPEFDDLGFEPIRLCDVANPLSLPKNQSKVFNPMRILGWLPRYWSYKTDVDQTNQAFWTGSANGWNNYVVQFDFNKYLKRTGRDNPAYSGSLIDYRFFKMYPSIVDPLFYVVNDGSENTDQFVNSLMVNAVVDLPLSVDGLPY